ncbi:tar rna binding protein isoform [Trichuris trichiura]|uniref:Tar rna binding protein isoform n=1 Tax=Trichuris trichiura TaxID=36087 RepID=A0A077ZDW1_TRITR|nr:tar rna binding protein isoform [Trichuris trichiura]
MLMECPNSCNKSPVGVLHELCSKRRVIPVYELLASEGKTHETTFVYRVIVEGVSSNGIGKSKRAAKQCAAARLLEKVVQLGAHAEWGLPGETAEEALDFMYTLSFQNLKSADANTRGLTLGAAGERINGADGTDGGGMAQQSTSNKAAALLHEKCSKSKWFTPVYEDAGVEGPSHNLVFYISVQVGALKEIGSGRNKKLAKQNAARKLLETVEELSYEECQELLAYCKQDMSITIQQPFPEMDEIFRKESSLQMPKSIELGSGSLDRAENEIAKFFSEFDIRRDFVRGNHLEMLHRISREESWDYEFLYAGKDVDGLECFFLQLSTVPVAVVWGSGASLDEAKERAAWNAFCYLSICKFHQH